MIPKTFPRLAAPGLLVAALGLAGAAMAQTAGSANTMAETRKLLVPLASAEEGLKLFVGKGCVVCHAVNGVGGKAAPALDAETDSPYFDVFDFAARMWRGAPTMIVLQEMELAIRSSCRATTSPISPPSHRMPGCRAASASRTFPR